MAGLSKIDNGSNTDWLETLKALQNGNSCFDLESSLEGDKKGDLKCSFDQIVSVFSREIWGNKCVRPLPPMLGDGQSVDLYKLYLLVRKYGGYEAVSRNGLWDFVVKEFGLSSGFGTSLKLIYAKYLVSIDIWMQRTLKSKEKELKGKERDSEVVQSVYMMDLESETREFSSENTFDKEKDGRKVQVDLEEKSKSNFTSGEKLAERGKDLSFMDLDAGKDNGGDMLFESGVVSEGDSSRNHCQNDEVRCFEQLNGNDGKIVDDDSCDIDFRSRDKDGACNGKRKRECVSESLNWVKKVAKDPCNKAVGSLPEKSKWKYFGDEQPWKHVMLVRQAMVVERKGNSSIQQSIWQKKQRMHPTMYEDHSVSATSRYSQRIVSAKITQAVLSFKKSQAKSSSHSTSSDTQSDLEDPLAGLWLKNYSRRRIPLGIYFQAEVPEWTEKASAGDSKWLGTRIWPQEKGVNRNFLIERDPTGFGRRDLCGCEFKGSFECVRFHVSEKRIRLKLELGAAFYHWHIDKMGEEVALSWNKAEELNFEAIVRSNPPSQGKCFWEEIHKKFNHTKREQLVSYYFNVFLLRRRGLQNRSTPIEISSDDDDLEFETTTNCRGHTAMRSPKPSYCSPKKTHLNFR
ncbi:AT-rich interactive domain-containing protein 1-like [Apium graveolens]|uniref:AT-rich interactive domain-containing protein 1-like n=1 Tax=Apium graveolens TaxID=4045 RepID=UPI003D7907F9